MPLVWTDEKPKADGWYWMRGFLYEPLARVGRVRGNGGYVIVDGILYPMETAKGFQWAGPIPEPEEPKE